MLGIYYTPEYLKTPFLGGKFCLFKLCVCACACIHEYHIKCMEVRGQLMGILLLPQESQESKPDLTISTFTHCSRLSSPYLDFSQVYFFIPFILFLFLSIHLFMCVCLYVCACGFRCPQGNTVLWDQCFSGYELPLEVLLTRVISPGPYSLPVLVLFWFGFLTFELFLYRYLYEIICLLFLQISIYRRSFSKSKRYHRYTNHQTDGENKIYKVYRKSDPKQVSLYL